MAVAQLRCMLSFQRMSFQAHLKAMQSLCEIQRSNENSIPSRALVWQSLQSLRANPLDQINKRNIIGRLADSGAQFGSTLSLESVCCILHNG